MAVERTIRQAIMDALRQGPLTAREISKAVGATEKEVITHLPHVERSVNSRNGPERFVAQASECLSCGFGFGKRERLKTPSKCPVCRSEEITETRFKIEVRSKGT